MVNLLKSDFWKAHMMLVTECVLWIKKQIIRAVQAINLAKAETRCFLHLHVLVLSWKAVVFNCFYETVEP